MMRSTSGKRPQDVSGHSGGHQGPAIFEIFEASFTFTMNETTARMLVERTSPLTPEMDMNATGNRVLERYASLLAEGRNELLALIPENRIARVASVLAGVVSMGIGIPLEETRAIFEEVAKIIERGGDNCGLDDGLADGADMELAEKVRGLPYLARFVLIDGMEISAAQQDHEDLLESDSEMMELMTEPSFSRFITRIPLSSSKTLN